MAGGDDTGLAFQIAHEQQNFRLIELPDELLDYLSSDQPKLQLKSVDPARESNAHAVLCTATKTYQIRQNETSNTVFLTIPDEGAEDLPEQPRGLTAISTIASTLELAISDAEPSRYPLLRLVPTWPASYVPENRNLQPFESEEKTKLGLFESLPCSHAECAAQYLELCLFTFDEQVYRPSAQQLCEVWQDIMTACLADDIPLIPGSSFDCESISTNVVSWPQELVQAVMNRLLNGTTTQSSAAASIGSWLLEASTIGDRAVTSEQFLESWRDALPESWRGAASLELLTGNYQLTAHAIRPRTWRDQDAPSSDSQEDPNGKKRKWHEKFKATRKK